jgi:hypothetical protein
MLAVQQLLDKVTQAEMELLPQGLIIPLAAVAEQVRQEARQQQEMVETAEMVRQLIHLGVLQPQLVKMFLAQFITLAAVAAHLGQPR